MASFLVGHLLFTVAFQARIANVRSKPATASILTENWLIPLAIGSIVVSALFLILPAVLKTDDNVLKVAVILYMVILGNMTYNSFVLTSIENDLYKFACSNPMPPVF